MHRAEASQGDMQPGSKAAKEVPCREPMVTKPGLIGNGRKTIFGEGALESFAKNCARENAELH
jgi:hypothetical protein